MRSSCIVVGSRSKAWRWSVTRERRCSKFQSLCNSPLHCEFRLTSSRLHHRLKSTKWTFHHFTISPQRSEEVDISPQRSDYLSRLQHKNIKEGVYGQGVVVPVQPILLPICDDIEPPPCINIYSIDKSGNYTFEYYTEVCAHHECSSLFPENPPPPPPRRRRRPPPQTPIFEEVKMFSNKSTQQLPTSPMRPRIFPSSPYSMHDAQGKFIRNGDYWFCAGTGITYGRVEIGTGLAPGLKEDQWAQCQWLRMQDLLGLGADCGLYRHTCNECLTAYLYFICAIAFTKCEATPGGLPKSGVGDIYGPRDLPLDMQKNITYTVTKPCRALCFEVIRRCPPQVRFQCHLKESRDWADTPYCNGVESPFGSELYI